MSVLLVTARRHAAVPNLDPFINSICDCHKTDSEHVVVSIIDHSYNNFPCKCNHYVGCQTVDHSSFKVIYFGYLLNFILDISYED